MIYVAVNKISHSLIRVFISFIKSACIIEWLPLADYRLPHQLPETSCRLVALSSKAMIGLGMMSAPASRLSKFSTVFKFSKSSVLANCLFLLFKSITSSNSVSGGTCSLREALREPSKEKDVPSESFVVMLILKGKKSEE